MKVKLILPSLAEAGSPLWRPIKYSLFPPIGLATLAGHFSEDDEVVLVDQHVEKLDLDDRPDLVLIQVYTTNAYRSYRIADYYRLKGVHVALGGIHVSAVPEEAASHADTIMIGPGDDTLPDFIRDFRMKAPRSRYYSRIRNLDIIPKVRRDLIKRGKYLVPNSLVVSRGCPHHCDFCYKDTFYQGGRSFYTRKIDAALEEIDSLPGRHLYFLDDHLFGDKTFARQLFMELAGRNRVFQAAATVQSVQYRTAVRKLHANGIMINGSFVFGMDDDDQSVFARTVDWAVANGMATSTFHIVTPYPGTPLFRQLQASNRITSLDWDSYTTREPVYEPIGMTKDELRAGYAWAYDEFYCWKNIYNSSLQNTGVTNTIKQFMYAAGWKKFEPLWNLIINLQHLDAATPLLEFVLATVKA
ncbi:MAG: radical SAM protein [Clostridia bacterium]|jgi:radical SAM superfamily enzyme YgiQ (UPF0313 family)